MLYFDNIEVSKGVDVNKTSESKEHDVCHYLYFLKVFGFNQISAMDAMIY